MPCLKLQYLIKKIYQTKSKLRRLQNLSIPKKGDFFIDGKYTFEVGGKNKGFKQIKDLANSYIVADNIEIGAGNKIPLWLFGF